MQDNYSVRSPRITRICEHCGAAFSVYQAHIRQGKRRFCSQPCYWANRRRPPRPGKQPRICEQCSSDFFTYPALVRRGRARFCSQPCAKTHLVSSFEQRFWAKYDRSGECWIWTGQVTNAGYGKITVPSPNGPLHRGAHRVAWELTTGKPVPQGMHVCHTCDNRLCGRADDEGWYTVKGVLHPRRGHLWIGTAADNMTDMVDKQRGKLFKGYLRRNY